MTLTEQAKKARRDYYKQYRAEHKEKIKENQQRYWERRAQREQQECNDSVVTE